MWIDKFGNELTESKLEDMIYEYYDYGITDHDIVNLIEETSEQRSITICGIDFSVGEIVREMDPLLFTQVRDEEIDYRTSEDMYELARCAPGDGDSINMFICAELDEGIVWKETEDEKNCLSNPYCC